MKKPASYRLIRNLIYGANGKPIVRYYPTEDAIEVIHGNQVVCFQMAKGTKIIVETLKGDINAADELYVKDLLERHVVASFSIKQKWILIRHSGEKELIRFPENMIFQIKKYAA